MQTGFGNVQGPPDPGRKAGYMTPKVSDAKQLAVSVVYNGDTKELTYQPHQAVQALLEHAKKLFGVVTDHLLSLFGANGGELTDNESVEDAGVKPGDKLVLGQSVIKGG
jgi:hypothetical protein